ncbi:MAG: glycosyltransferase family 39 protein [Isosphaeraceae bacterium]
MSPANFPQPSASLGWWSAAVAAIALTVFSTGLFDSPFADEYAYMTQSYYADLFFTGRHDDPAWLHFFAFDLQPLPKYLIGMSLHAAGLPMPRTLDAARWYLDYSPFGDARTLAAARVPSILTGTLGCVAVFLGGTMIFGRGAGALAALLLIANPLYRLHAHRAMTDVPTEALTIVCLALALFATARAWSGRAAWMSLAAFALAGLAAGLSILCKFNGLIALMVVGAWCGLGLLGHGIAWKSRLTFLLGGLLVLAVASGTFLVLNPALTAHPRGHRETDQVPPDSNVSTRIREMLRIRLENARHQKRAMSHNAMVTPADKLSVLAVQGFGRFGPFGPGKSNSEIRYQLAQDWGSILWLPLVLYGAYASARLGIGQFRDGRPPTALALLIWAVIAWGVIGVYLPMAWDRYLLPIQAPNALLAAVGAVDLWNRLRSRLRGKAVPA